MQRPIPRIPSYQLEYTSHFNLTLILKAMKTSMSTCDQIRMPSQLCQIRKLSALNYCKSINYFTSNTYNIP
jgi:hypothetical protein